MSNALLRLTLPPFVLFWFATIFWLGQADWFNRVRLDVGVSAPPFPLVFAAFLPPVLFLAAWRFVPGFRSAILNLNLDLLVGFQIFRVIGIVFLFLWALGELPMVFAFPAGFGDVAVGIYALFVTRRVILRQAAAQRSARWLVVLGLVDFLLALGTAGLAGLGGPLHWDGTATPIMMQSLPMVLIPGFLVPIFAIAHLAVWLRLSELPR